MRRALPVRDNPVDLLAPLALAAVGLFLMTRVAGAAAARGGPGAVVSGGGRDDWWNPADPIYGPAAPQLWLKLLDAAGHRIYTRGGRVFRSDASLVPAGEVLYLAPDALSTILGSALAQFGYDYVARAGVRNNGDGTLTDMLWGITIGLDALRGGIAG